MRVIIFVLISFLFFSAIAAAQTLEEKVHEDKVEQNYCTEGQIARCEKNKWNPLDLKEYISKLGSVFTEVKCKPGKVVCSKERFYILCEKDGRWTTQRTEGFENYCELGKTKNAVSSKTESQKGLLKTVSRFLNKKDEETDFSTAPVSRLNESEFTDKMESKVKELEEKLNTVGEDQQLAQMDLQNKLQESQQLIQTMSSVSELLYNTTMAIIRKIGG